MYSYFDKIFSKNQCGFRKGFNTQHILLAMIEKMKASRDNKQFCAAILTDLSKAFDCICCDLLIAKLNAYGFALMVGLRKLKWVLRSVVN